MMPDFTRRIVLSERSGNYVLTMGNIANLKRDMSWSQKIPMEQTVGDMLA